MAETMVPGSPEAIKAAELLEQMASVYPGDPFGDMMRDAAELRGVPYDPPQVTVIFGDDL